jgi:L-asparaginase II
MPLSHADRRVDPLDARVSGFADGESMVTVWRGGIVENRHRGHVAVTTATGDLLASAGDPARVTLVRSTAKPVQALAVLEASPALADRLDGADLALMCASHSAEPLHLQGANALLSKCRLAESDLRCGGHPSLSEAVNHDWIRRGFTPTPICSNCSGKHIGLAGAAFALTGSAASYHLAEHPIQTRVRQTLSELIELPLTEIVWATDGCNLPTPAFALQRLAMLYARLADAADAVSAAAPPPIPLASRTRAMARLFEAMHTHPSLVAGTDRFCTSLMQAYPGQLIGKVGADGCYAVGLRAGVASDRFGAEALGIAVKVEDGHPMMVQAIVCEVLRQLQLPLAHDLRRFAAPLTLNTVGEPVGHLEVTVTLSAAQ